MLPPQDPTVVPSAASVILASGLTFLNRWFGLATILLSNLLAATVVYIVLLNSVPKRLQNSLYLTTGAALAISLLPAAMTLNFFLIFYARPLLIRTRATSLGRS
jgi:hypothetical protein